VDVTDLLDEKRRILAAHASQDQWLDATQNISAYLETMVELNREVGSLSRSSDNPTCAAAFNYAEGWRQHIHLGLGQQGFDPLAEVIRGCRPA
jgi:hypothetical protein